jgi:pyruvate/2-oxoacid:ferredoxin oxidoreductase beta subunit
VDPGELKPVKAYFELQGRFRHLMKDQKQLGYIQARVRDHFEKLRAKVKLTA